MPHEREEPQVSSHFQERSPPPPGAGREPGPERRLRGPEADQQLFEPREQLRWFTEKVPVPDAVCRVHLHTRRTGIAPMESPQLCVPVRGPTGGSNKAEAAHHSRRPCCLLLREVAQAVRP